MENVVKNAEGIYRLRKKIVYEIKRVRMEQAEEGEEDVELDLRWTHEPYDKFGKLISGNINMIKQRKKLKKHFLHEALCKKLQAFLLKLFSGEFENKESALKILKNIKKKYKNQEKNKKKLDYL